jgi:hypothetical protein
VNSQALVGLNFVALRRHRVPIAVWWESQSSARSSVTASYSHRPLMTAPSRCPRPLSQSVCLDLVCSRARKLAAFLLTGRLTRELPIVIDRLRGPSVLLCVMAVLMMVVVIFIYVLWAGPSAARPDRAQTVEPLLGAVIILPPVILWAWKHRRLPLAGTSTADQVDAAPTSWRRGHSRPGHSS